MLRCRKCDCDCTEAYQKAPVKKPFRCKCGSADFIEEADPPKTKWELKDNDRRLMKRFGIKE
jgi:hypothetical protein